ncbi:MAG: elongation factor G [Myxococcota bacterium]
MSSILDRTRNIGISAHIDSGKTTLSERILYYTGRIHRINEVRGGDAGAKMDFMDLEREKGITITSAATTCFWRDPSSVETRINLIDTPGHVDFTIEVERSLRVLDGAIMVLCGVAGVQSQSITVDRQMKRYRVPRLAFINKLDRQGADPFRVTAAIRDKLALNAVLVQIPIGISESLLGVVDLIEMRASYFEGDKGETRVIRDIPADLVEKAQEYRAEMLDKLSMYSDEMTELLLEEKDVPVDLIRDTLRKATMSLSIVPVFMGSAFKNKGVQNLLDAVTWYLPSPLDRELPKAFDARTGDKVDVKPEPKSSLIALAFKITDEQFGQLTYTRMYAGTLRKGDTVEIARTGKRVRIGRLVRMHANDREDVDAAYAGDIIAIIGVDCASGDTFCTEGQIFSMEGMFVPDPVIQLAITPKKQEDSPRMSKALNRFMREDPTFRVMVDPETNETLISGMGELHLDIYIERMKREYRAEVNVGQPKVAYRETITQTANFDYKHKKQTGGSGQYGHVVGTIGPCEDGVFKFIDSIVGGAIPREFIPACEKGFREATVKGPQAGYPVINVQINLVDGTYHDVDSSEMAFKVAARQAFKQGFAKAAPIILEPIMIVEVETPSEFTGTVQGNLSSRRGVLLGSETNEGYTAIRSEVPLSEMFGYSTELRSMTQGKANFSMEFGSYRQVPNNIQTKLIQEAAKLKKEEEE